MKLTTKQTEILLWRYTCHESDIGDAKTGYRASEYFLYCEVCLKRTAALNSGAGRLSPSQALRRDAGFPPVDFFLAGEEAEGLALFGTASAEAFFD